MPTPAKLHPDALRLWATQAVATHAEDFTAALARRFGVSRMAASGAVRQLEAEGFVLRLRGGTRPRFGAGPSRLLQADVSLPGVDESLLWDQSLRPWLDTLPAAVANIAHYGFTELVNNANDHSGGQRLQLRLALTPEALHLWLQDDGVGVFERVRSALGLADLRLALLDLSKGKVTTDPARHTGEGLFFTSRAFHLFELRANGLLYRRRLPAPRGAAQSLEPPALERLETSTVPAVPGTQLLLSLRLDATHTMRQVFDHYTSGAPDDLSFDRTVVPVKLAALSGEGLVSRSQARRLTTHIEGFRWVELDFEGVDDIGQAFADELFRVFAQEQPALRLTPVNAAPRILAMLRRVRPDTPAR
jgi:STAS-like domain of unknown function (DUF4325)